ncbi:4'-phosphopantetheinyl transferase superfamily protein [Ectopseudomonas hydrolytica]|uniref:Enterobactin synthase component D n=1 Tax=Ectopseudomonas hydrolytica TaxID=2493633 RepID=A0ABY5ADQ8_9GAMM|nr:MULTISPECIES: 4'-phosphopantetheinyl transferase superfamily protein [Pseudomonas]MDH0099389.1 4'-phosphopantetheinyl transferase superfamily protein [Pseudomonas sp. GD04158]MPT20440.1 4'-phosphopantetheinyl transferase superfamily protein [Pseudomonas sp.]USR41134.1 4'-phosphopantetheinyl transferase superfamily protein [Pseudomonas hydrolytica]WJH58074.1 4'-phosphopantetheinyl transferase superfamily protein [Pseudomonas guguanensis]
MNAYHPACCSPLDDHDPLPRPLAGTQLISTRFDPALVTEDDFARCGIAPVRGVAKRQAEYLAGRLCAREALRRVTGEPCVPAVGEDRAPQWPPGVAGSITHGDNWAAALVAPDTQWRALGMDVERLLPADRALRLQGEILTPAEVQRLQALDDEARAARISLTFSLKESLFKALYPLTLTRFYFHDAELLNLDEDSARLRLLIDLHADWRAGAELDGQFVLFEGKVLSLVAVAA